MLHKELAASHGRWPAYCLFLVLLLVLATLGMFKAIASAGYREEPNPPGMMCRIELGAVHSPAAVYSAFADPQFPGGFVIESHNVDGSSTYLICDFPQGVISGLDSYFGAPPEADWDFDGDGFPDTVESHKDVHGDGIVEVLSGRDRRRIYIDSYDLEYETCERGFPLADLDNDGYAELGILYPRQDRSTYDFHPFDALLGAKSWFAVVSYDKMDESR